MSNALVIQQVAQLAAQFSIPESDDLVSVLKATAFKGNVSDAQMSALLIVAGQYGLNPWTKEIYAFPDQNNGIVPVVGVDGWSRIINSHSQFDGMDFEQDDEKCTCIIYRKDRGHPIKVTEYLSECKRPVKPWQSHPKRMLRHKSLIQCARLAFGYVGIYDQDEAERIAEVDITPARPQRQSAAQVASKAIEAGPTMSADELESLIADLEAIADEGRPALEQAWQNMSADTRRAAKPHMAALGARADALVVEVPNV
jgi:phage recombination protein Bet